MTEKNEPIFFKAYVWWTYVENAPYQDHPAGGVLVPGGLVLVILLRNQALSAYSHLFSLHTKMLSLCHI